MHLPLTLYDDGECDVFLGAFTKLQKATVTFVVCVRPHGRNWLPLDGFSINFICSIFRKSVEKIKVSSKSDKNIGYFT
jgi:hypothetical protein